MNCKAGLCPAFLCACLAYTLGMHPDLASALSQHALLGHWYATPMTAQKARELLPQCERRRQQRLRRGAGEAITLELASLIARFHLGKANDNDFEHLTEKLRRRHSPRALALLHLIHGQLLASRQRPGATAKLDKGFRLATHLLHPEDYFALLNRHRLLAALPDVVLETPLELKALLETSAVKLKLESRQPRRGDYSRNPGDLYG